jgi:isoleucyl-tRNA synthetase
MPDVKKAITQLTQEDIKKFNETKQLELLGFTFGEEDIELKRQVAELGDSNLESHNEDDVVVILDFTSDESLNAMYLAREMVNRVQRLRKDAKLQQDDPVEMWVDEIKSATLQTAVVDKQEYINKLLRRQLSVGTCPADKKVLATEVFEIEGETVRVTISEKM